MITVYDLRKAVDRIRGMQEASLSKGSIGLQITHGLVGSDEWWHNIEAGKLQLQAARGVVSGFWPGQYGDGPAEFEVKQPNGQRSTWLCEVDPGTAKTLFVIGRRVEVEFVLQDLKTVVDGSTRTELPIAIRLDPP